MLEKKTVVDQIEITRNGTVQIRIALLIVEDGVEISSAWHRTALPPGADIAAQIANVNDHLEQMGKAPVQADDVQKVSGYAELAWTPDVVSAHQKKLADIAETATLNASIKG